MIALNRGTYDFLRKSSVKSDKKSDSELVQELEVTFSRTPQAAEIAILNSQIHPPEVHAIAVPATTEETVDSIRHGSQAQEIEEASQTSVESMELAALVSQETIADQTSDFISRYWILLVAGIAVLVTLAFITVRSPLSGRG